MTSSSPATSRARSATAAALVLILIAATAAAAPDSRPGTGPARHHAAGGMIVDDVLVADDVAEGDFFGASVAVRGNLMAVGAPGGNGGAGYVVVYELTGENNKWTPVNRLTAMDAGENAHFGFSVEIEGVQVPRIVVGAPGAFGGRGAVYGYTATDDLSQWRIGSPSRTTTGFGHSIAVDGKSLLVGAPAEGRGGVDAGAVYAFAFDERSASWTHKSTFHAPEPQAGARFGESVALLDGVALIGEPGRAETMGAVYSLHGIGIVCGLNVRGSPGAEVGASVALAREQGRSLVAAVGAPGDGVVHLLRPQCQADRSVSVMPGDNVRWERFGERIALDGGALVVGFVVHDPEGARGVVQTFRTDGRPLGMTQLGHAGMPSAIDMHDGYGIVGLPDVPDILEHAVVLKRDAGDGTRTPPYRPPRSG